MFLYERVTFSWIRADTLIKRRHAEKAQTPGHNGEFFLSRPDTIPPRKHAFTKH